MPGAANQQVAIGCRVNDRDSKAIKEFAFAAVLRVAVEVPRSCRILIETQCRRCPNRDRRWRA